MSQIRVVYGEEPDFPATDQHPDAVRYYVLGLDGVTMYVVDAIGGEPTAQEVYDFLHPPAPEPEGSA